MRDATPSLDSLGDDMQLANVDRQNILQKQQQTLQLMSNVSKMLHDTADVGRPQNGWLKARPTPRSAADGRRPGLGVAAFEAVAEDLGR